MLKMLKEIKQIMSKREKIQFVFIFFVILGKAFLDLISVAAILPLVSILTSPEDNIQNTINSSFVLRLFAKTFNQWDANNLLVIIIVSFCLLFIFKALYGMFHTYIINRFTLNYSRRLTRRLMQTYLFYPYEFHLENNSSTLIRKSTYDVELFIMTINDGLTFLVNISTASLILAYLFISDWRIALIAGLVVVLFSIFLVFILKPKSRKLGKETQDLNSYNYKFLSQAFNGIKESKISNKENYFINEYDKNRGNINNLTLKKNLLNAIPTQFIELVGMIGICTSLLVVIFLTKDTTKVELVNKFAVFAYAFIKLLPSATTMTNILNYMNFYKASVDSLAEDLKANNSVCEEDNLTSPTEPMYFDKQISLEGVTFFYNSIPNNKILNNINVNIQKNTSVAFCGSSGAGKTTLIDLILGLLSCREGRILCDGIDITSNMRGWRSNISYIPQTIYLTDDTIRNNVAFGIDRKNIDDEKIWKALDMAQLKEYVQKLPDGLNTVIGERGVRMSGGQRQRIGIARAFYRDTNIIVFDEATSALDYETEKSILNHVSKFSKDKTMIIITHRLNTIESCDHIYKVESGSLRKVK